MPTWFPPRQLRAGDRIPASMGRIFKLGDDKWVWEWGNVSVRGTTWDQAVAAFERHRHHHASRT